MKLYLQNFFIALILIFSVELHAIDFALTTYELFNAKCPVQNIKSGTSQELQNCRLGGSQEGRTKVLKVQSGELAENAFLASLASERSELMSCAEKQISEIEKDPISLSKFVDDYAAKLTMLAYDKRQMQVLLPALGTSKKASEDYGKIRQHSERILATMSYSEIGPMRNLIRRYLNELDQFRPEGIQAWFINQMKTDILSALPKAKAKITQDRSAL
jgi:hypothetical protein